MRRAFFFIGVFFLATASFASIPRNPMLDGASSTFEALPETRIGVSDVLVSFERPASSNLNRALHQAYADVSRTNASGLGRFLSVDPVLDAKTAMRNPQAWNRYAYVMNNPVRFTDPTGKYTCRGSADDCQVIHKAIEDMRKAASNLPKNSQERTQLNNVLTFFGKRGQRNGVTIAVGSGTIPGAAGGTMTTNRQTTIGIDFQVERSYAASKGTPFGAEIAGTLTHEGQHGIDQRLMGLPGNRAEQKLMEIRGYTTEARTWQGLGIDAPTRIWTNATGFNPRAVEEWAETATQIWCNAGGSCQ